jgi:hypothetical protein
MTNASASAIVISFSHCFLSQPMETELGYDLSNQRSKSWSRESFPWVCNLVLPLLPPSGSEPLAACRRQLFVEKRLQSF